MSDHPIENLMKTTMENLKEMVDVNKIVGDTVETPDGNIIIPISRVSFGFVAGGSDFQEESQQSSQNNNNNNNQFGGGTGGGISVQPVAFLVVGQGEVRLLPVDRHAMLDRLIDLAPQLINQIQEHFQEKEGPGKKK